MIFYSVSNGFLFFIVFLFVFLQIVLSRVLPVCWYQEQFEPLFFVISKLVFSKTTIQMLLEEQL